MKLPIVMSASGYNNLTGESGYIRIWLRGERGTLARLPFSKFSSWLFNWFVKRFPL